MQEALPENVIERVLVDPEQFAEVGRHAGLVAVTEYSDAQMPEAGTDSIEEPSSALATKTETTQPKATSRPKKPKSGRPRKPSVRDGEEDLVRLYLEDTGTYELLTQEDEVRLAKLIEKGVAARDRLANDPNITPSQKRSLRRESSEGIEAHKLFVNSNLRLVTSIAKKYQRSGLPLLDLIQEGNLGLIHAVDKFDHRKGFKFSTYATWWIRQAIQRGVANTARTIRLPVHAGDNLTMVLNAKADLEALLGRQPTVDELAEKTDIPKSRIKDILSYTQDAISTNEPVHEDSGDAELGDFLGDPAATNAMESKVDEIGYKRAVIEAVLPKLDEREQRVIILSFGLDGGGERSTAEVGNHLGMTHEGIRRIKNNAIAKLKNPATGPSHEEIFG